MRDLKFISESYLEFDLPKDQRFLWRYFRTHLQKIFLKYFLTFNDWSCFNEHTGICTTKSYLYRQEQRYYYLTAMHKKAKSEMDLDELWRIESGKYTRKLLNAFLKFQPPKS